MIKNNPKNSGFTIVELMIATSIFSFILLLASGGVIAIGRIYYKNLTSSRVQTTARSVMEDVSRSLQFSQGNLDYNQSGDLEVRCFGNDRYTYTINEQGPRGLRLDQRPAGGACTPNAIVSGTQLLGSNMRLLRFDVSNGSTGVFKISVKVSYSAGSDQLSGYDDSGSPSGANEHDHTFAQDLLCKANAGSFCSVSGLETTVNSRIK